jgi:hypothetical protein
MARERCANPNPDPNPNRKPSPYPSPDPNPKPKPVPKPSQARTRRSAGRASDRRSTCCIAARHTAPRDIAARHTAPRVALHALERSRDTAPRVRVRPCAREERLSARADQIACGAVGLWGCGAVRLWGHRQRLPALEVYMCSMYRRRAKVPLSPRPVSVNRQGPRTGLPAAPASWTRRPSRLVPALCAPGQSHGHVASAVQP